MKSAWLDAPNHVVLREAPTRTPGAGEVLVRVRACGVCGTDVHFSEGVIAEPMPLGHEAVGVVEQIGPAVDPRLAGRHVIVQNYVPCNECENCLNGNWVHCLQMRSYMEPSQPYYQAGMADYMLLPTSMVAAYEPDGLTPRAATLAEPLAVALDMVAEADVPLRADVAVFGPGPIGLMAVRLCALRGARRIFLTVPSARTERYRFRAELGRKLGATDIVYLEEGDPVERVLAECPHGVDRVLATAPPRSVPDAVRMIKYGGIISFIGVSFSGDTTVPMDLQLLHFRKAQLRSSYAIPDIRWPLALDLLRSRAVDPDLLITHVFPLEQIDQALRIASAADRAVAKVVVECGA